MSTRSRRPEVGSGSGSGVGVGVGVGVAGPNDFQLLESFRIDEALPEANAVEAVLAAIVFVSVVAPETTA